MCFGYISDTLLSCEEGGNSKEIGTSLLSGFDCIYYSLLYILNHYYIPLSIFPRTRSTKMLTTTTPLERIIDMTPIDGHTRDQSHDPLAASRGTFVFLVGQTEENSSCADVCLHVTKTILHLFSLSLSCVQNLFAVREPPWFYSRDRHRSQSFTR
jgi:hypothetical protein